jgi:hypothetical protein
MKGKIEFSFGVLLIKPPGENSTPGTLKAFQVSLVEPVAHPLSYDKVTFILERNDFDQAPRQLFNDI